MINRDLTAGKLYFENINKHTVKIININGNIFLLILIT